MLGLLTAAEWMRIGLAALGVSATVFVATWIVLHLIWWAS